MSKLICEIPECQKRVKAQRLCVQHWHYAKNTGTLAPRASLEDRFLANVDKSGDCWEWTGTRADAGYGRIQQGRKSLPAHRIAYTLAYGEIPSGKFVDHMCHNRACVKPGHLRLATQRQNQENRSGANRNSKSGVRGVSPVGDKWLASVRVNNKAHSAGLFSTIEEAGVAVRELRAGLMPYSIKDQQKPFPVTHSEHN